MTDYFSFKVRLIQILVRPVNFLLASFFTLALPGLIIGCRQAEVTPTPLVVTEVVIIEEQEVVVTRLVRQVVAVTVTPAPETAQREPVTLDLGYVGSFPNVDPQKVTTDLGGDLLDNLFVGLTRLNYETNQVEPELAQSWAVNGRVWTFTLRDDIFWVRPVSRTPTSWQVEPVRPVTAADAVAAIRRICQRSSETPDAFIFFIIEGCEAVYRQNAPEPAELEQIAARALDETTLEITLTKPASYFLTMTTMWALTPIPGAEIAAWSAERPAKNWLDIEQLMLSGPFVPVPATWGSSRVTLQRNPYWTLPRRGNVEVVNINYLDSPENAFKLWEARSLDVSPLPAARRDAFLSQSPTKARLVTEQTVFYLGLNFNSAVFREPALRRAFSAALNREELARGVYGARALPMRHLSPPGVLGAPPLEETGIGYSPDFALMQLAQSGFRSCRLLPPIRLMVSTLDLSLLQAELVRDMWARELGCDPGQIVIEQVEFGTLLANTRPDAVNRPDVWELGWASYYPDAHNWLYDLLHCTESENRQNRPCSEADELMMQATAVLEPDQRAAIYRRVENLFFGENGEIPLIPLYVRGNYVLVQNWLTYTPAIFGGEQFDTYVIDADLKRLERSR